MSNHTPGPWKVVHSESKPAFNVVGAIWGGKYKIARCPYVPNMPEPDYSDEALANARLISAAPELLQACIDFVRKVDAGQAKSTNSYNQMQAAIFKATGIAINDIPDSVGGGLSTRGQEETE
jgi:hypothetical protein